jgi:ABC-2 type transport system permease protein
MLNKLASFLKKDFYIEKSYKFSFALSMFSTLFSLFIFFFINKFFGERIDAYELKVNYFSYVFLSIIIYNYTGAGLGSISQKIRAEKLYGTLDNILNNENAINVFLLSIVIFNILLASFEAIIYILAGLFFFKLNFSINLISFSISLFLSIICFSSLGIMSSSFIIMFKKGDPLSFFLNSFEGFFGGVYFPISVLPFWAQYISKILPITYSIGALQKSFYLKAGLSEILNELIVLFFFSVFLLPLSIYLFKKAIYHSKIKGTINQY